MSHRRRGSIRFHVVLAVVLAAAVNAIAESKPVTPESFYSLTWVGDPQWSPAGDRIAFTTSRSNEKHDGYDSNLWMVRADGSGLRQLTYLPGTDNSPRWSDDGSEILFLSTRNGSAQACLLPAEGGEARCVTSFEVDVSDARWIPGAHAISFMARVPSDWKAGVRDPKEMVKQKYPDLEKGVRAIRMAIYRAGKSYFNNLRPHLFTLDLESGELRQVTAGEVDVAGYSWASDGKHVAVTLTHLGDEATDIGLARVQVLARDGSLVRELTAKPGYYGAPVWRPANTQVLVEENNPEGYNDKVFLVDTERAAWNRMEHGFDGNFSTWRWSRDGKKLFALAEEKGDIHVWTFDPATWRARRLTSGRRQLGIHSQMFATPGLSFSPDASRFAASETVSDRPEELVVGAVADGGTRPLTDLNKDWRVAHKLVPSEKFTFNARDGHPIDAWIIPPAGLKSGEKRPLVLEIHGGPRTQYGEHFMQEFQMLAGMNYGVLYVNPRGSTGYGEASTRATINNWGGTPYEDLMDAVDAAIARYAWVDKDRLGVAGGSYGGYMTAWVIGQTTRFKAAIPMRGVYNFYSFPLTTDIPHFTEVEFGGLLWSDPGKHWKLSPIAYADVVKTPTLIIHSENDFRAPMPDAEQYYAALRLHGVPAEFVRYAEEGHELSRSGRPDRRVDRLERIAAWFKRWLEPSPQ
ncbi:MAG TPA: S9 family peptidase [Terriglobales bacterium]|nr:S9 family peptidase [Terriglobales bacterium]